MDEYGDGGSIQDSSNLQDFEAFSANPTGHGLFDASQYAFFGNNVVEEVELGGLEDDDDDLGPVGFNEEELQVEMEEGDAFGSLPNIDDLSITFSKVNKTVGGLAGVSGDWGSGKSSSAAECAQEGDFSWFDRQVLDAETGNGSKNLSSQPYSSARLMESNSLLRTSSHPEQHPQHPHQQQNLHNHFSRELGLIPKSTFTSYPPPGKLQQDSPNGQSSHTNIMYQPSGLQIPISSSKLLPFPNPKLQLNTLTHGSQFGGNLPQVPHGRLQNQWMNQNNPFPGDRSCLSNNILPQTLSNQNGLVPPQMMSHQRPLQTRMHHPVQPAFAQLSGLQPQLFNPHLSVSPPVTNNFEMLGSPDLRDQRAMAMLRSRQGMRYLPQGYDTSVQKVESGWPRFKAKYMSTFEIENVLRLQLAATHSNDPYVDDYYHQACLSRKSADDKLKHHFCPTNLSDDPARVRSSAEPHPFLQVDALGRVSFSSIRRPRPLLEVDSNSSSIVGAEPKFTENPLELEPMLATRVTIEDGICLLLDVDDIDRFLQFNQLHDGGVLLRQRRQVLLEGLASSLQLVDPLGKNGLTVDLSPKDDLVFLRLASLPKGRKLLLRYLQLLLPGELTRVVCMAIFRHLRFLFGNVATDPGASASTANLAVTVSSCVHGMELKSLAACLASVVCSVEHPPLRPVGSPTGDGATVVLKSVLDRATELLTDPHAAGNCSMQIRSFWQASFDAFFGLLTNYCFNKYDSVLQSVTIQGSPDSPDVGSDVAKAISREMPVELLRASLPHTNEQQRKILLEFTQRSMSVLGSSSQV